ncbi:Uncharacterised protein [Niallia circulans]|uniref:hypothetical protein n=1 Tax=Niallia circulans TaxID=1397 RepID=UPI00077C7AE8|nr:hypothetical protein [Niallia circulans]MDR4318374.1 hypothetical protein [Niallia circulans]MED3841107.1 hypothetical protein [Niallia circulans]MED4242347.1 hypothetical protein [Niallia circulans]MED4250449.1 hypothetical protein [Niallia circulans]QKH59856.1 hypothetical protein FOC77_03865 [Niallia circulans]
MKQIIWPVLLGILILSGCGNSVHENISEEMATDTEQILEIFDENIKEERSLNEREEKIFESYSTKYGAHYKTDGDLTEEETRLYILTNNLIDMYDHLTTLSSDKENYENQKSVIKKVIKEGEI